MSRGRPASGRPRLTMAVIAIDIPLLFGFSVARYAEVPEVPGGAAVISGPGAE